MTTDRRTFTLDGHDIPFDEGQSVLDAALAAGLFIPFLCHKPGYEAHGSCRVCMVRVGGRWQASCTTSAAPGLEVESTAEDLVAMRRDIVQFLFTEGNHFCPSCEASGSCTLQAVGYELGVTTPHYPPFSPTRPLDASHPEMILDFNRCILCELCVRASAQVDRKNIFALSGRGPTKHLVVSAESGRLGDTSFSADDAAAQVCPVGVFLPRGQGFRTPLGARKFDVEPLRIAALRQADGT
ncbi:2Fe-2S iron-sulfur cluster-binding protein [Gemmatimonas sp.]|uniref:2Fe-2S iron-sulfur cluster-binding protein n=1 Tax=Gemmatimonas sp. TaxID=1962908 RepID=UPI0025C2C5A4|nr:2Fe-2S iron-sulfur cluster-binding protein [Gemmatimonas sp.]MCA2990030.1 (2Fe-2S)-binding protein [Gemmatimonas sp.]